MAGQPRGIGPAKALLIVLPLAFILGWTQRAEGPSRAELAKALAASGARDVMAADLRSLRCTGAPGGFDCHWRQRVNQVWQDRTGHVTAGADGWRMTGND